MPLYYTLLFFFAYIICGNQLLHVFICLDFCVIRLSSFMMHHAEYNIILH